MSTDNLTSPFESCGNTVEAYEQHDLSLQDEVCAIVGSCMLARQMTISYSLSPNESTAVQILMQGPETVESIKDKIPFEDTNYPDKSTQSVLRAVDRKSNGDLVTITPEGRHYVFALNPSTIESQRKEVEKRKSKIQEARDKLEDWVGDYLNQLVEDNSATVRSKELYSHVINTLIQNLGWRLRAEVLDLETNKSKNLSRVISRLSELFPEGLIEKFGKRNTTEYMFNLDVLLELKKPEEAIQLDVSVVDEFREYINIDNELSIEILSALRQFGDLRSADIKKIIESSGGIKITKNRFYRAIKRLKDNSLIEADAGNSGAEKQNPIYSISNIDFDSYRENQIQKKQKSANKMVRKSYREKKSIKERIKTKDSNDNHAAVDDIKITKAVLATSSNLDSVSEDDIEGLLKEYEITWEELLKILKNIKSTTSLTLLEFSADMSSFNLTGYAKHAIEKGKNLISS